RPRSALVTGYDFVSDAALKVRDELTLGLNPTDCQSQPGGCVAPTTLIQPEGDRPTDPTAWSANDLRARLFGSHNDLIFLNGHFAAGRMIAADYRTDVSASEVLKATPVFSNTILFGLGCHSGYNVPSADAIPDISPKPDFAAAFAHRGATFVAATGYAY